MAMMQTKHSVNSLLLTEITVTRRLIEIMMADVWCIWCMQTDRQIMYASNQYHSLKGSNHFTINNLSTAKSEKLIQNAKGACNCIL